MSGKITFKGAPLTLVGRSPKIGMPAADFRVVAQDLKTVTLADFKGSIKIFHTFPSLDTPVCDSQIKEFNQRAAGVSAEVLIIGISKDLPFAQKRFCESFGIKGARLVSDYQSSSFGINYGLLIKELNLLARAAIIVDKDDIIRYVQVAAELASAPDYQDVFSGLEKVIKVPVLEPAAERLPGRCSSCEGGIPPLGAEKVEQLMAEFRGWELVEGKKLVKEFKFRDFPEAKYFLDLVAVVAEEQKHHPNLLLIYNKLKITLTTHASGGLTENDFIMAKLIDELGG